MRRETRQKKSHNIYKYKHTEIDTEVKGTRGNLIKAQKLNNLGTPNILKTNKVDLS